MCELYRLGQGLSPFTADPADVEKAKIPYLRMRFDHVNREDQIMMSLLMSASLVLVVLGDSGQEMPVTQEVIVTDTSAPSATVAPTGHRPTATGHGWLVDWFGPMPQTCYQPRFGCYPGNPRTIHRYPAFHGYYYRAPYNYRHLFEYPWHAQPYEPQPLRAQGIETVMDQGNPVSLQPVPEKALE